MGKEEFLVQLASLEQEANKFQEQMYMLDQQVTEIQGIQLSLKELENSKEKTMFANLGKNIYIKTDIVNKGLLVDVGNKIFVKKDINETLKLIEEQINKIMEAKGKILERLQELQEQMQSIISLAEKEEAKEDPGE